MKAGGEGATEDPEQGGNDEKKSPAKVLKKNKSVPAHEKGSSEDAERYARGKIKKFGRRENRWKKN